MTHTIQTYIHVNKDAPMSDYQTDDDEPMFGPVATVNSIDYPLVDDNGTYRFPHNRVVCAMYENNSGFQLNEIWENYFEGNFTLEEVMEVYRLIGYSLFGFWEIFGWELNTEGKGFKTVSILLNGEEYPE